MTSLTDNNATDNSVGIYLSGAGNNNLTGNVIKSNQESGLTLDWESNNNLIYNNLFSNSDNVYVSYDSTGNTWNITPTPGTNIAGGPNLGGNYWATPDGIGWSETHLDIGMGFTEPYNVTDDGQNVDQHPLVLFTPTPPPTPIPNPSGSSGIIIPPSPPLTLPFNSTFTGNDIPANMQSCHSYNVGLTVKNTGTMTWSSTNGVVLIPSSSDGFTFDPSRCSLPDGVVVHPGDSYTFPVKINVPCPMKNGTYQLRFRMAYTVQTKSGPVEVSFGEALADSVNIGTTTVASSGIKAGVKSITPSNTITGTSGRFTTIVPGSAIKSPAITQSSGYYSGYSRNTANATATRNFYPVTGL